MTPPRLTYVGHSYHQRTGSTVFLQELLARHFDVTTLWDDSWRHAGRSLSSRAVNETRPDFLVLFQQLPSRRELARIHCRNVTWMPMHDSVDPAAAWGKWRGAGLKALCFSRADHDFFSGLGWQVGHAQYWPAAAVAPAVEAIGPAVFFWMRMEQVTWDTLKSLLGPQRPQRIVLRVAADPSHRPPLPSAEDMRAYNIEVHDGWMEKDAYQRLLASCSIFVAPRRREGIGQATLEAMSMGLAVIAPNRPTMNEYIEHDVTGYLYDPDDPQPLDLSHAAELGRRAAARCAEGHERWLAAAPSVVQFVTDRPRRPSSPLWRLRYGFRL